eukprot:Hpha_TRINITY_DN12499_c0_g1::TRINITY_DN12499_c0_g1_i1::g.42668::m.42668/K20347/TMED2, EMP24; p24 family protein beta-1
MRSVALLLLALAGYSQGLSLKVEPGTEDCFTLGVKRSQHVTFSFQCVAGGKLDIDARVLDSNQQELKAWSLASDGRHYWTAATQGDAQVCFSNKMSRWTPKWVSFYLVAGSDPSAARIEHLDPIEQTIKTVVDGLDELQVQQRGMRALERVHRDTIDDTNSRILMWSIFQALLLFIVGIVQVRHVKRFLEVKSTI